MLKIAFATSDGVTVDQHFGWCERFDVYQVDARGAELIGSRIPAAAGEAEDDRLSGRLDAVRDCAILHVTAIGGSAAAKVTNAAVMPVKVAEGARIGELIVRVQAVLAGSPPPWMRKVLERQGGVSARTWTPA